jgi:hypothetical protein
MYLRKGSVWPGNLRPGFLDSLAEAQIEKENQSIFDSIGEAARFDEVFSDINFSNRAASVWSVVL